MEIFNRENKNEGKSINTPVRASVVILIMKLIALLFLFELIYGATYYVLALGIPLPFDLHHHVALLIFILGLFKILLQTLFILHITLSWANNTYQIDGEAKHLVKKTGIINTKEDVYELDTVRSLTVNQSWIGKIFNYGDIILKTSASGGYQVVVSIDNIQNPWEFEQMIKECL